VRIICFLLLCLSYSFSYSQETHTYRELYIESFDKEDACNSLNTILEDNIKTNNNIENAYLGVSYIMKSKYKFNPISKLYLFSKGKEILERSIKEEPSNLELKFLRLSIQQNIPEILAYNQNIEEDQKFINNNINKNKDGALKKLIKSTLKTF